MAVIKPIEGHELPEANVQDTAVLNEQQAGRDAAAVNQKSLEQKIDAMNAQKDKKKEDER